MTARHERGLDGGVEPIPDWIDEDLGQLAIAEELRVPPWVLANVPRRWVNAALVKMETRKIVAERQRAEEAAARKRKTRR